MKKYQNFSDKLNFRLDTKNTSGYEWLFLSWSPDTAPIRQKMLYASTKASLKQEFGTSQIKEELHGTVMVNVIEYLLTYLILKYFRMK